MVQWPARSKTSGILRAMLREDIEISHEELDRASNEQAANLLRHLLVDVGVLEARAEGWASFEQWLDRFIADRPARIARVLAPYCRWDLTARMRLAIRRNGVSDGVFARSRAQCRVALNFLTHLDSNSLSLLDCSQSVVEDYLEVNPREHVPLRSFLVWARRSGHTRRLEPPRSRWSMPSVHYSAEQYSAWMTRFAEDESLDLRARICGLICGMTGRPSSVVATLTRSHIEDRGDSMRITLGKYPVLAREPLAVLIRQQLAAPRRWDIDSDWLFPSKLRPGAHTDYSMFVRDLQAIGCSVVRLRGAAMLNLTLTVPIGPLADVTGISIGAATKWQRSGGAAYARYPAMRRN